MSDVLIIAQQRYADWHNEPDCYDLICFYLQSLGYSDKVIAYAIDELP